jgi:transcriptional regulator with XRE-family HTH domain
MDINTIKYGNIDDILISLAKRLKQRRLELNYTQKEFSRRVGIGYDAYRRFEATGDTSLKNIVQLAVFLDDVETINQLFSNKNYQSLEQIIKEKKLKSRQRASKNK